MEGDPWGVLEVFIFERSSLNPLLETGLPGHWADLHQTWWDMRLREHASTGHKHLQVPTGTNLLYLNNVKKTKI